MWDYMSQSHKVNMRNLDKWCVGPCVGACLCVPDLNMAVFLAY